MLYEHSSKSARFPKHKTAIPFHNYSMSPIGLTFGAVNFVALKLFIIVNELKESYLNGAKLRYDMLSRKQETLQFRIVGLIVIVLEAAADGSPSSQCS